MRTRRAVASVLVAAAAAALLVRSPALADGATLVPSKPLLGFDTSSAQDSTVMAKLKSAHYQAVGVYLPVSLSESDNRHDKKQVELTSGWVSEQLAAGWSILPVYLGVQAPNQCQPVARQHKFWAMSPDPARSYAQGVAAADDAMTSLTSLGFPADAPVYYDLEAYNAGCTAVEAFLGAWSAELASHGHPAGVYGSLASTMKDLGDRFGAAPACSLPEAVWPATGNGSRSTDVKQLPTEAWTDHQRVNQFKLDATFDYKNAEGKAAKLTIDKNWVDGPVVGPTGTGATPPVMPVIGGACISAPPGGVEATRGDRVATIAWAAPSSDGGSQVTGYLVDDLATGSESEVDVGTTRLRLTGLANGATHRYTVTAVNGVGDSVASATVSVTPAGRPRQVAKPTVVGKRRAVTVRWKAPRSNGSPLTRFRVSVGGRTVAVGPRKRTLTVKGLRPGSYKVTVVAVNGVGAGPASPAARVKVRR